MAPGLTALAFDLCPAHEAGLFLAVLTDRTRQPKADHELEELGDELIISQETGAHAPQPRADVAIEHPSVVIAEATPLPAPRRMATLRTRRERSEQTVVIRDRRSLDRLRKAASERPLPRRPRVELKTITLIGLAALASLAAGTLIAALVDSSEAGAPSLVLPSAKARPRASAPAAEGSVEIDLDTIPDAPEPERPAQRVDHP